MPRKKQQKQTKSTKQVTRKGQGVLAKALEVTDKRMVMEALKRQGGNQTQAAEYLGICRRALYDRLIHYGLLDWSAELRAKNGVAGPRKLRRGRKG